MLLNCILQVLKKTAAILLLTVFAFNTVGYRLLFNWLEAIYSICFNLPVHQTYRAGNGFYKGVLEEVRVKTSLMYAANFQ